MLLLYDLEHYCNKSKRHLGERESVLMEIISRETGRATSKRLYPEPAYKNDVDYVILDNAENSSH